MLSDRLKELRKRCNLPQRKVAAALDIDTTPYCKIGNSNYPQKETGGFAGEYTSFQRKKTSHPMDG